MSQYFTLKSHFIIITLKILGITGGLCSVIFSLSQFFYKFYYRHKIYEYLMNENFSFDLSALDIPKSNLVEKNEDIKGSIKHPIFS